jgi:hypothetical protein
LIEAEGNSVSEVSTLPYPAMPRFNTDSCPDFCYSPEQCKGRTACPKSYSCTE